MNLKPTKPLSGFIELLPAQQRVFDECARLMQNVMKVSGFNHLEVPSIERAEVLTDSDNWDEIATQMYLFEKGGTKMGLRYDGTVGLARYVSGHMNGLVFPFRAYQFAKNYRGERPQRGRYREFYQMDLDIMGQNSLSDNYDAEIVSVLSRAYESIEGFVGKTVVKVGDRKFWDAMFEYLDLDEKQARTAFVLIDKKDKLSDFQQVLSDEIGTDNAKLINNVFTMGYKSFLNKNVNLDLAINNLDKFMSLLGDLGVKNAQIDLGIMRGHSYYTGVVFEFFLIDFPNLGAIGGGGRYENLTSKFSKTKIIGVGAAVGFSRMMVSLLDDNKIDLTQFESQIDVAVLIMGQAQTGYAMSVLSDLRDNNIVSIPYLDSNKKFKNQMEFADKIRTKFSIIIGEDEVKDNVVSLKDMTTGQQKTLSISDALKELKK